MSEKNYITPAGLRSMQEEFNRLWREERPAIVETVAWAASNGDRSENGDYIYGKRKLREIDKRLRFLSKRLEIAEVVDPCKMKSAQVLFGATVTVLDEQDKPLVYRIVGADESDPDKGKISWISPIARALLKAKVGDFVTVKSPQGERDLEITKIEYCEIS